MLRAVDEDHDPQPAVSPILAITAIVLALALAIALAFLTRPREVPASASAPLTTSEPAVVPDFVAGTPSSGVTTPSGPATPGGDVSTGAGLATPRHTRQSRSAVTSAPPSIVTQPTIRLSPASGPGNSTITVNGTGWPELDRVTVSYAGRSSTTAEASRDGSFTTTVRATGTLIGAHQVTATDGARHASATFRQGL